MCLSLESSCLILFPYFYRWIISHFSCNIFELVSLLLILHQPLLPFEIFIASCI